MTSLNHNNAQPMSHSGRAIFYFIGVYTGEKVLKLKELYTYNV